MTDQPQSEAERLLTAEEVAKMLGVDPTWIYRAVRENRIPHIKLGRYRRFQRSSIAAWLKEREEEAA